MGANVVENQQQKVSPSERAALFNLATRQCIQEMPAQAVTAGGSVSFQLPKSRLGAKLQLLINGTITLTHASDTDITDQLVFGSLFNLIKNIRVESNIGFSLFNISGVGAYIYNLLRYNSEIVDVYTAATATATASRKRNKLGITASSGGTANTFQLVVDLPFTINDRDPVGLMLLQSDTTLFTVTVDFNAANAIIGAAADYTVAISSTTLTPVLTTFTIPDDSRMTPDISTIKLVQEFTQPIAAAGQQTVKLSCGNTYRKTALYITDSSGGDADADLATAPFEIWFNTADSPYRIPVRLLAAINQEQYGACMPAGLFVFDWSAFSGLPNYGGIRDLIDTEKLTEFWIKFTASAAGNVRVVNELLAKLS